MISHGNDTSMSMPPGEVFIIEFAAIDAITSRSIAAHDVTCLDHEVFYYSMHLAP